MTMEKIEEQMIKERRFRLCKRYDLWVCNNGWNVFRQKEDSRRASGYREEWLSFDHDEDGNRIIRTTEFGDIRLDSMVATCFCPPCPADGFLYELCHKDSNPDNCCSGNLEWRRAQPVKDATTGLLKVKLASSGNLWIFEDGTVHNGLSVLPVIESWFDGDMGLEWEDEPYVHLDASDHRSHLESLMVAAGFVQGDRSLLHNPVVLHIDMDFTNLASANLEWVESSDPRYTEYSKRKYEDRKARFEELNRGKTLPNFAYWH